ncbi:hypothetical protein ROJ8625_00896 [Roseivivax jejudonensis]|uniref:Hedgehog/Intein (Hint) domain-containing protein n=1 Tax=Roseivivax jejudonensis TaxID=1529041 RepID=A0A1X6YL53_9RHOB|nr:Hint domain-containing protein [Roseivivax jejudonensis]SLN22821.1 hypothetical protein ROJ8625_00896 [Roseivivax jejudonensis]
MSWIAVTGGDVAWTCPRAFPEGAGPRHALLTRGSLVVETRLSPEARPQMLLGYERRHPWSGRISLQAVPGGGVVLVMVQGEEVFHTVLPPLSDGRLDVLRLTYAWDAPARWGRLSVERPEEDGVRSVETPPPPPLMLEDIYTMIHRPQLCERDADVVFFAASSAVEPVGPVPTLTGPMPVETETGVVPVSDLGAGMHVCTRDNGVQRVVGRIERVVPALGSFRPVRLRAPYLGLQRDLVVAPQQRLLIGGSEVEYLFGRETVLIPAAALANGFTGTAMQEHLFVRYHQLVLPRHDALRVVGADLESLYLGRLRRRREELAATLLSEWDPASLPEHFRAGHQVLRPFEAITLAEARAA